MTARFTELGWRATPLGEISLRRRWDARTESDVYEVKLDDEYLMSSLFTVAEVAVATLALAELDGAVSDGTAGGLDVVVGGLGLGYTAHTVLADPRVASLLVVEALPDVIDWHRTDLIPDGAALAADARCTLAQGDFFALAGSEHGLDPMAPGRLFDAIVVDIDHSPSQLLHPSHAPFYEPAGLGRLAQRLRPGGVFTLWSNDPPEPGFLAALDDAFSQARAEVITFPNPLQERDATNTVYVAITA